MPSVNSKINGGVWLITDDIIDLLTDLAGCFCVSFGFGACKYAVKFNLLLRWFIYKSEKTFPY